MYFNQSAFDFVNDYPSKSYSVTMKICIMSLRVEFDFPLSLLPGVFGTSNLADDFVRTRNSITTMNKSTNIFKNRNPFQACQLGPGIVVLMRNLEMNNLVIQPLYHSTLNNIIQVQYIVFELPETNILGSESVGFIS
jgi:hypothetical protein